VKRPGKYTVAAVVGILMLGLFLAAGCESCGICGGYVNEDLPNVFVRIDSDGSCIGYEFMAGRWKIYDDELLITSIRGPYVYEIQEDRLIDMNGWVWVKENT
jgi:hypothetical protein